MTTDFLEGMQIAEYPLDIEISSRVILSGLKFNGSVLEVELVANNESGSKYCIYDDSAISFCCSEESERYAFVAAIRRRAKFAAAVIELIRDGGWRSQIGESAFSDGPMIRRFLIFTSNYLVDVMSLDSPKAFQLQPIK